MTHIRPTLQLLPVFEKYNYLTLVGMYKPFDASPSKSTRLLNERPTRSNILMRAAQDPKGQTICKVFRKNDYSGFNSPLKSENRVKNRKMTKSNAKIKQRV